jgi:hypothetical protein
MYAVPELVQQSLLVLLDPIDEVLSRRRTLPVWMRGLSSCKSNLLVDTDSYSLDTTI